MSPFSEHVSTISTTMLLNPISVDTQQNPPLLGVGSWMLYLKLLVARNMVKIQTKTFIPPVFTAQHNNNNNNFHVH